MIRELDLPVGPVADKLTIWPMDDGRYGVDAVFNGASGYERAEVHRAAFEEAGVEYKLLQGLDRTWSLRMGPFSAFETGKAISAFLV